VVVDEEDSRREERCGVGLAQLCLPGVELSERNRTVRRVPSLLGEQRQEV